MPLIALEEHYAWDPVSADNVVGNWLRDNNVDTYRRLYDRGQIRLQQMDAAGIDFQILSLFDPVCRTTPTQLAPWTSWIQAERPVIRGPRADVA